jgi:hypothetical protein
MDIGGASGAIVGGAIHGNRGAAAGARGWRGLLVFVPIALKLPGGASSVRKYNPAVDQRSVSRFIEVRGKSRIRL